MKSDKHCSFCLKGKEEVGILFESEDAFICDECVTKAYQIVQNENSFKEQNHFKSKSKNPFEIKTFLDQYVIGQDEAKKTLAVAVYNHYKRLLSKHANDINDVEIDKSNILLIGETGTGKTLMAKTIARLLDVPFCIADATVITESGYVGEDVETILTRLLQAANGDVKAAERGIVYLDEVDKIARRGDNASITRDVSGEGVQQGLLKLLEGSLVYVPPQGGRKHPEQNMIPVDTSNILFICGGAFSGLEKVVEKRMNKNSIGFNSSTQKESSNEHPFSYVSPADLRNFGLIPELIGRMPVITHVEPLDKKALKEILTKPKNALVKQYVKLFEMESVKLHFTQGALEEIASKTIELELGARGLRSLMEKVMKDLFFEIPGSSQKGDITIDKSYVNMKLHNLEKNSLKVA